MNHFVFTGPESSGKTTLAKQIAELKNGIFIPEFAREYLTKLGREYSQNDLLTIAKGQFSCQEKAKRGEKKHMFFDTDLLTIKIWSEFKYGSCDKWIINRVLSNKKFIYILCKPDLVWEYDSLRENQFQRNELYEIYLKNLGDLNLNFIEIGGEIEQRINVLMGKF